MDALKNISANIPDWLRRLEELSGQIEQRQIELAKFAEANSPSPSGNSRSIHSMKSLRNRGSTESLRPTDEPADRHLTPEDEGAGITPTPSPGPVDYDVTPTPTPAPGAVRSAAGPEATAAAKTQTQATPSSLTPAEPPTAPTATANVAPFSPRPLANGVPLQRKQTSDTELMEATRARARALVRKRIRSDSMISADGAAMPYRSKNMVLVYYDSYVQSFFEELVKFVSGSRNLMRKAKMAAKVAHIKRMADLEMNGYSDDDGDNQDGEAKADDGGPILAADPAPLLAATTPPTMAAMEPAAQKREGDGDGDEEELPPLKCINTRQMYAKSRLGPGGAAMLRPSFARASARGPYGGSGGISSAAAAAGGSGASMMSGGPAATAFDTLDKGLEFVQSTCERAAHQFLRDGDCEEEITKIKSRLAETNELAATELERKLKEGPAAEDLALEEAAAKGRSYRPPSMRRESLRKTGASPPPPPPRSTRSSVPLPAGEAKTAEPEPPTLASVPVAPLDKTGRLEVDDSIDDDDYDVMPKLVYKSTRRMMRGGVY